MVQFYCPGFPSYSRVCTQNWRFATWSLQWERTWGDICPPGPRLPHSTITWKVHDSIFLCSWIVFYSIYVPIFHYPSIGWRTFMPFPFTSYCLKSSNEHGWISASWVKSFGRIPRCSITGLYGRFILKTSPLWFPLWLHQAAIPPTVNECSLFSHSPSSTFCQFLCWSLPFWLITVGRL